MINSVVYFFLFPNLHPCSKRVHCQTSSSYAVVNSKSNMYFSISASRGNVRSWCSRHSAESTRTGASKTCLSRDGGCEPLPVWCQGGDVLCSSGGVGHVVKKKKQRVTLTGYVVQLWERFKKINKKGELWDLDSFVWRFFSNRSRSSTAGCDHWLFFNWQPHSSKERQRWNNSAEIIL